MAELTTLARPYATAVFEVARAADKLALWNEYLQNMASITANDKVKQLLGSPSLTAEQKSTAFNKLLGDDTDNAIKNFVGVLSDNNRLALLPQIQQLFAELKARQEQTIAVEVTAAFAISSTEQETLVKALKVKLERDVTVSADVDKGLIGGVIVRAGDTVIDGSVKGRLAKLAESMTA